MSWYYRAQNQNHNMTTRDVGRVRRGGSSCLQVVIETDSNVQEPSGDNDIITGLRRLSNKDGQMTLPTTDTPDKAAVRPQVFVSRLGCQEFVGCLTFLVKMGRSRPPNCMGLVIGIGHGYRCSLHLTRNSRPNPQNVETLFPMLSTAKRVLERRCLYL